MLFVYCFHALGGSAFKYVLLGANSGIAGQITKLGSSVAMRLNKTQTFVSKEQEADALVYKVRRACNQVRKHVSQSAQILGHKENEQGEVRKRSSLQI